MLSSQMQACSVIVIIVFDLITIRAEVSCHGRSRYVRFFLIDTVLDVIHRSKMGGTSASSWCRRSCVREQTRTGREITSTRLPEEPPPPTTTTSIPFKFFPPIAVLQSASTCYPSWKPYHVYIHTNLFSLWADHISLTYRSSGFGEHSIDHN